MELLPHDLIPEMGKARIIITNYHAFKKDLLAVSSGTRDLLEGRDGFTKPMKLKARCFKEL